MLNFFYQSQIKIYIFILNQLRSMHSTFSLTLSSLYRKSKREVRGSRITTNNSIISQMMNLLNKIYQTRLAVEVSATCLHSISQQQQTVYTKVFFWNGLLVCFCYTISRHDVECLSASLELFQNTHKQVVDVFSRKYMQTAQFCTVR